MTDDQLSELVRLLDTYEQANNIHRIKTVGQEYGTATWEELEKARKTVDKTREEWNWKLIEFGADLVRELVEVKKQS